jgi:hypothetical protein
MSAAILRFPVRGVGAVLVVPYRDGGTLVLLPNDNGWLFGDKASAEREARALARQHGLPVRRRAA